MNDVFSPRFTNELLIQWAPVQQLLLSFKTWNTPACITLKCLLNHPHHPDFSSLFFLATPNSVWDFRGIEPVPPALAAQSLNHWATREVPQVVFYCYVIFSWFCPLRVTFYQVLSSVLFSFGTKKCETKVYKILYLCVCTFFWSRRYRAVIIFCKNFITQTGQRTQNNLTSSGVILTPMVAMVNF